MAHRQLYSYALQPSYAAAASTVSPAPPPPQQPLPPKTGLSTLYGSSADHYFPDTTYRFLARDGSEALSNYSGTLASSSSMYHHLPNTTASHLAYPQLLQHQEVAWPPGVEVPGAASAVEPLPPGVKRTSEGRLFVYLTIYGICIIFLFIAWRTMPHNLKS